MFGRKPVRFNFLPVLTLFLGGLAGAGIALLFAPKTGRQLQKQIRDTFDEKVESVQNVMKKVVA